MAPKRLEWSRLWAIRPLFSPCLFKMRSKRCPLWTDCFPAEFFKHLQTCNTHPSHFITALLIPKAVPFIPAFPLFTDSLIVSYCAAIHLLYVVDVIFCYGDISIRAIVIHSPLLFILSLLDRPFIYLCHLFHSTPHVFFIMLLFSALVSLFLLYNYQYAKARFTMTRAAVPPNTVLVQLCFSLKRRDVELNRWKGEFFVKISKQQYDYRCFRSKMHLKEIIFFAGRHLFRDSVIIIQIRLLSTRRKMPFPQTNFLCWYFVYLASIAALKYSMLSVDCFPLTSSKTICCFKPHIHSLHLKTMDVNERSCRCIVGRKGLPMARERF